MTDSAAVAVPKGIFNFSPYIYYRNEQLMKDCCLLPYMFHRYLGYRSVVVTARKEDYTYHDLLPGLELEILDTLADQKQWTEQCCRYVESHYREIDVLFCFGLYPAHIPLVHRYKELRPDGQVILKLDANIKWVESVHHLNEGFPEFFGQCDVITVESRKLKKYLSRKWSYKIEFVPNGSAPQPSQVPIEYADKENVILTVGRIGTEQKANHILMEAFREVADKLPEWRVKLVGSIDESFLSYIESFFAANPHLRDRIVFPGKIVDKAALEEEYRQAKIFAITSKLEGGTPNVWAEAARNGCYMVCSAIDAADEATDGGRCGRVFAIDDASQLADLLLELCRDEAELARGCREIQTYRERVFDYELIVRKLHHLLQLQTGGSSE